MFQLFAKAVHAQFSAMSKLELYTVEITGDELWAAYLAAFPPGTDPIYRTNTEHTCSCCKNFIRNLGNVVALKDGELKTIWDFNGALPAPYDVVSHALAEIVRARPIVSIYRTKEHSYGAEKTHEGLPEGGVKVWNHFHGQISPKHYTSTPEREIGEFNSRLQVFRRGLAELKLEALNQISELIKSNNLYRGEEHRKAVSDFTALKRNYDLVPCSEHSTFALTNISKPAALFRNTVIGTLAIDLSEGADLEQAVKSFEAKVAPTNYKRPKTLITESMIKSAMKTLHDMGFESSLERRFANIGDITINNVLWADRLTQIEMKGGLESLLKTALAPKAPKKGREMSIEDFMSQIVPSARMMDLFVENRHAGNFVSITAPVHEKAEPIFKWDNGFAWSYDGNVTDSMRQRVADLGGRVTGPFRFTHSWNYSERNASLMDLHVFLPGSKAKPTNGQHDIYGNNVRVGWNNRKHAASGGVQDVDYVNAAPVGYIPIENISFPDIRRMPEGTYICKIHNWKLRSPTQGGFKAEIELNGIIHEYEYTKPLTHKEWVTVAEVTLKDGAFTIKHHLTPGSVSREKWGIQTEQFIRVETLMYSPNHWDGQGVGNRHYIFALQGCRNDLPARGIYNEYLRHELEEHRRVFEVLGDKTKCPVVDEQLSGLGFSSTKKDSVKIQVDGQIFNVTF